MEQTENTPGSGDQANAWCENQALELWKYFGGVGAADKNTMITVESLLLTLSTAVIGYLGTTVIDLDSLSAAKPYAGIYLAILGLVIAGVAGYVALLYGGYSNWNWAKADAIARARSDDPKWKALLPTQATALLEEKTNRKPTWSCARALQWGRPCIPTEELPPIFRLFALLAVGSAILYLVFLVLSVRGL
jgi:hypothetical protein